MNDSSMAVPREIQRLENLVGLAEVLSQQNEFEEILRVVTRRAAALLGAEIALILMINPRTNETVKTFFREGSEGGGEKQKIVHSLVTGWVLKNRQAFISADLKSDERFTGVRLPATDFGAMMCVPLRVEGNILGTILLSRAVGGVAFAQEDLACLERLAVISAPYLRNVQKIQEYFEPPLPEAALLAKYEKMGMTGKCKKFVEMLQAIEAAARCDVRVLLEGESGTGKELIARAIHLESARSKGPFVAVDCGAIPAYLIESEMFGHVKGAFTGAMKDRVGLVGEANQGTLFLDEVNNLPMEMQAKLMRMLQESELRPVGSNKSRKVDVRIISAASGPLTKLVAKQKFRDDLYYRLYVYPIAVPSLADRVEDIPLLANHFLKQHARQQQKVADGFSVQMVAYMKARRWAGNIRELENFVERLVTLAAPQSQVLGPSVLPPDLKKEFRRLAPAEEHAVAKSLTDSLAECEERIIRQALESNDWNQSRAARALSVPVQTLRYKMSKLGIVLPS